MFVPMFNVFDNKTRHQSKIVGSPYKNSAESFKSSFIGLLLQDSCDSTAIEDNSVHLMGGKRIKGVQMTHDGIKVFRLEIEAEHHFAFVHIKERFERFTLRNVKVELALLRFLGV
mgnify:CR=1 FL=1